MVDVNQKPARFLEEAFAGNAAGVKEVFLRPGVADVNIDTATPGDGDIDATIKVQKEYAHQSGKWRTVKTYTAETYETMEIGAHANYRFLVADYVAGAILPSIAQD